MYELVLVFKLKWNKNNYNWVDFEAGKKKVLFEKRTFKFCSSFIKKLFWNSKNFYKLNKLRISYNKSLIIKLNKKKTTSSPYKRKW
jgi:hypothetical protein